MSRECFYHLLDILLKDLSSFNDDQAVLEQNSHRDGSRTQAGIKLASTLRFLAGGSVHDN